MHLPLFTTPSKRLEATRRMTQRERLVTDERDLRFYTNVGLLVAVGIGFFVSALHGDVITAAATAYGAAVGLGGILGFLFGVPGATKAPITINNADSVAVGTGQGSSAVGGNVGTDAVAAPSTDPSTASPIDEETEVSENTASASQAFSSTAPLVAAASARADQAPATNTSMSVPVPASVSNLEQVADWVTKLLLGGGLTQMQRIPPKVWQWSRVVALGILRDTPQATEQLIVAQQAFAAGLLVYGFIVGFFGGFLITKLQLGKAISSNGF